MKITKINIQLWLKVLIIAVMFDAYSIINIGDFSVTPFIIVASLFIIYMCFVKFGGNNKITINNNIILVLFSIYVLFNWGLYNFSNINSFIQTMFYIILFLLSYRKESEQEFEGYINLFNKVMTIMAVYGIYQFIGRIIGLPFTDFYIEGHMVSGYNWSNTTNFMGMVVYRSNAIFREPSYFSQMLAISILLEIVALLEKVKNDKKLYVRLGIKVIAMILTLSGTCYIIITVGLGLFLIRKINNKKLLKRIVFISTIIVILGIYTLLFTPIGDYLISRVSELFVYTKDASAGYVRFRSWIFVLQDAWKKSMLFGAGIGTGKIFIQKWSNLFYAMTLNGLARVAAELGIIGFFLWSVFIISFQFRKKNIKISNSYFMIACVIIPFAIAHETFSSNSYWIFLLVLNSKIVLKRKMEKINYEQGKNYSKLFATIS
ncbi:O-antigen ligase family protein [Faecalibacillus intestinalis]|uniref:O-antigen ligase family protein n=1 Tax=Faecalibacillus intestinalis TaxID=1982626 RepID=UPI003AB8AAE6